MAEIVAHVSSPWFQLVVLLVVLLAANATSLVRAGDTDTVAAGRPLSGNRKLVSPGGKFALGFFQTEGAAGRWYIGIWYHKLPVRTPVWVANRDRPVSDPATSRLTIAPDGNLVLLDSSGSLAWSTNTSTRAGSNENTTVVAVLLDTGNLVLAPSSKASDVLWQSFDHVGDTWLPGAKLWLDKSSGAVQGMTSWRARGDPTPGPYTLQLENTWGRYWYVLLRNDAWRGYYHGAADDMDIRIFTGALDAAASARYNFRFVENDREVYVTYGFADNSTVYRFVMDVSGQVKGCYGWRPRRRGTLCTRSP
ncbi:hypothetical protein PR202_gb01310 [Eleusine coracana subsp. coracana]|uniref:non-specific serine/threonine protein kinase n=1 Tax=Eleusine coracana subsp. coracana TaxID=191504 RepID=A0AAV5DWC9_ELECO|nr:hypothetical protein PR202_gb01310 [Eleusine coracana subsp. coracana]